MPDTLNPDPYDDRDHHDTVLEKAEVWVREAIVPTATHPLRTVLLLGLVGGVSACARFPLNVVGVVGVILLSLDRRFK